jgi:hypothetical protein
MTAQEWNYVERAMQKLAGPVELATRIKLTRTLSEIFARDAVTLETMLVDIEHNA